MERTAATEKMFALGIATRMLRVAVVSGAPRSDSQQDQVGDDGELSSEPAVNLKLINVSSDELVLSWNGTAVNYKRGWYWWEGTLALIGVVLFTIICVAVKGGRK